MSLKLENGTSLEAYQRDIVKNLARGVTLLDLPEMTTVLTQYGDVGNQVAAYISQNLTNPDSKLRLKINPETTI